MNKTGNSYSPVSGDFSPFGLTAWTYGIWDGTEHYNDTVAVFWPGMFSCARESRELFGDILPPDIPAIYVNHRGHGHPDDYSEGIISFPGMLEDIRMVSEFVRQIGFRKHVQVYYSVSCPPGFVDLVKYAHLDLPKQDMTIFISPPDDFYKYVPRPFKIGSFLARNGWIPGIIPNTYCEEIKKYAGENFVQIDPNDLRMRYMRIGDNPKGILCELRGFPYISRTYAGAGNELEGEHTMVVYGGDELTIPVQDILNFTETLRRRGADVEEVCMRDSGHWVTAEGNPKDVRILKIDVDEKKVADLRKPVYDCLDEKRILKPCGEQDLITTENDIKVYSALLEAKPYSFDIKRDPEGEGTLLCISR